MEEEQFFQKRIRELANTAYQRDVVTFTDFLNLHELHMVKSLPVRDLGVVIETSGGYDFAERQMVAFHPDALVYSWEYPMCCLHISPKALRFADKLSHRDYLGALLNLGVERSTVGDILVGEDSAWMFCVERMADFFLENLNKVKHTIVITERVMDPADFPKPQLAEITGTCSSVRLDAVIALAFQASRSSLTKLIEGGQVFVNGKMITSNGYTLKEGDLVSVRGKGRFRYDGILNQTKKGRYSVRLYRYV